MPVAIALGGDPGDRSTRARRRCRPASTRWSSPAGCAAGRRDGARARRSTSRCRRRRRSCWRARSIPRSARLEGPVRRPHRLLLAGARLSGLPPHGGHAPRATRSTRPPSSGGRRRRTTGSARPPSGIFLPIIRLMLPEIVDMNMPAEGVFHNLVIVSIKKRYPGQARKVMYGALGPGAHDAGQDHRRRQRARERPRPLGGRLAGHRQHRSRGATWSSSRGRWTISTTRRSATASAASSASTRRRRARSTTSPRPGPRRS